MRDIFGTICLAGAIQTLFLSIILIIKKNNRRANRYLSLYLIFMALDAFELFLGTKRYTISEQPYQLSVIPYSFIFGPSMFLYIALLTARINTLARKYLLLYVPFAITLVINVTVYFKFNTSPLPAGVIYTNIIINGGGLTFEASLYILSFVILQKYINRLKEYFSDIDALKLSLIRAGLAVIILTVPFIFLAFTSGRARYEHQIPDIIAILAALVLVFIIAFVAVLQPEIFNRVRVIDRAVSGEESPGPKYEKFRLQPAKEEEYANMLRYCMKEKKPYLREELTLQNLADELYMTTHHLSMILNLHYKQNFYNFINSYRVNEVKQRLADPEYRDHNILEIAYGSGFNSKSTFNAMFKKFTGKTPKEYRTKIFK